MHVPGHNPFLSTGPLNLEDLILYGTYSDLLRRDQQSLGGEYGTTFGAPLNFQTNIGDLGLSLENLEELSQGLGDLGEVYQYSGLSPEISGALQNVFSGSQLLDDIDLSSYSGPQGLTSGLEFDLAQALVDQGILDQSQFTIDPFSGSDSQNMANPNIISLQLDALPFVNIFDPESIAASLTQSLGLNVDDAGAIKAGEVKALTPEMIEKTTSEYYSPYEESERESLVEKLGTAMSKAQTGGFAGSGARQSGLSGAERLYSGGYGDILSDIMKMRGQATGDVLDTIYGYQELLDRT